MTETWIKDDNGNKVSIEYFGTKEAAQKALDSLVNCTNCTNCKNCTRCSGCSGCSGCLRCSDCSDCLDCSDCSCCSGCSDCLDCSVFPGRSGRSGLYFESKLKGSENGKVPPAIPTIPDIHKTIYAAASQPGSLDMQTWHTCKNTHCRAGWVVTLAGQQGKELEDFYNTELAAMMIYDASTEDFKINPARFFDKNDEALADMKKLAEESK